MAGWSQSHFLQSLGWATLNSFWQMALLWCLYLAAIHLFRLSSHKKYQLAVLASFIGFAWFGFSFISFYKSSPVSTIAFFDQSVPESNTILNSFLLSASITYLGLLIFPSYRLFKNWQFVQRIKKEGLQKANLNCRLFVQKISGHLGIGKKVLVYVSEIVTSPVTVGYLKPIILLPVAALNNLSTQQVEAVLLHELSHIKRYDYLVNFIISIIHTVLYFNPFVKQFMKAIEAERENCCDELVLQFGYDKVGYASALLMLEKISAQTQVLAMAATGKNYLLHRIEKIVGMEKKKRFQFRQLAGVLAALFCIVAFNSVLIIKEKKKAGHYTFAYNTFGNPFALFNSEEDAAASPVHSVSPVPVAPSNHVAAVKQQTERTVEQDVAVVQPTEPSVKDEAVNNNFIHVAQDDVDASLTKEQKEQVASTIDATKKVMNTLQWKEVEAQIADAMTQKEKALAHQEYKQEVEKLNWQRIEDNLKAQYDNVDWNKINTNLSNALTLIQLDSLQTNYTLILSQLDKAEADIAAKAKTSCTPIPDVSVADIRKAKEEVKVKVETLKALRSNKKVVRL